MRWLPLCCADFYGKDDLNIIQTYHHARFNGDTAPTIMKCMSVHFPRDLQLDESTNRPHADSTLRGV
ncbi:hypothetical protein PSDVSF_31530 [Pseudodesulfovibrio sediminis]|uniref:Uncharacterized protein n=1 Tax=Pseudodesulfovibrio sediminis TaxID=2810563 RepID=A0ABM9SEJ1_9BACT|nr:hypothetical protein PSDVSF_31530 [Pseudodesulfovibrio sediminis]